MNDIICMSKKSNNLKVTKGYNYMKHRIAKIMLGIVPVLLLFLGVLFANDNIGVAPSDLENDIRSSQNIMEDWTVDGSIADTMAAFISYPEDKSDHTFSVYVNRPGLSFGYFFRGGGDIVEVEKYIAEYTIEGYSERAFISMNSQRVERLEIDNGDVVKVVDIDCNNPFAIVLPVNSGNITFYDEKGHTVDYYNHPL